MNPKEIRLFSYLADWHKFRNLAVILSILFLLPVIILLNKNQLIPILIYLALPLSFVFIASPKLSFYALILTNFVFTSYYLTGFAIHPWDIAAFFVLASCLISWILSNNSRIDITPFDRPFIVLIFITILSAIFAHQPGLSIVPSGRIILIFLTFRAFYYLSKTIPARHLISYYLFVHFAISMIHVFLFFLNKGAVRIFGVSGVAFETFSMIGVPAALAFAIWENRPRYKIIFSLIFIVTLLAAIATQSRGPLLTIIIAIPVLVFFSIIEAKKRKVDYVHKYLKRFIYLVILALVILIFGSGIFLTVGERFQEMTQGINKGTIMLRYSLWKAAFDGFLSDPITGIGIGNFRVIDDILPYLKFDPVRHWIKGMSFHNIFLQYLCETGIFGALIIAIFGFITFRNGYAIFRMERKPENMPVAATLFIWSFIFFITIFYMRVWTWGQEGFILALILALIARFKTLQTVVVDNEK